MKLEHEHQARLEELHRLARTVEHELRLETIHLRQKMLATMLIVGLLLMVFIMIGSGV